MNKQKKKIPTHPGKVLQNRFLIPLGISQSQLARDINCFHPQDQWDLSR